MPAYTRQASADVGIRGNQVLFVRDWLTAGLIVLFSYAMILGFFWPTVGSMVAVWSQSRTFAHGFLVLPATMYLVWCYRDRVAPLVPTPNLWGLPVLLIMGIGWLIGHVMNMLVVEQLAVVAMLPGLVWTALGTSATRALLYPLGFLFFGLPVGTSLEPWLQDFTAAFVVTGLRLGGIPVYWEGNFLTIPSRTWELARDCAGLRYLLPGMALGYLYTGVVYQGWARRLGFLLVCLVVLIVANGLRAYGIIIGDHLGIAEGTDHRVFSYSIYGMAMFPLLWVGLRWREPAHYHGMSRPAELRPIPAMTREDICASSFRAVAWTALVGVILLALAPLCAWFFRITP